MASEEAEKSSAVESEKDFDSPYTMWQTTIRLARKGREKWEKTAEKLTRIYSAHGAGEHERLVDNKQPFHIFHSNVQTLQPAVYMQPPKPVVERRFKDADPVGRVASQALERALQTSLEQDDFDPAMEMACDDWLIRGMGQCREVFKGVIGSREDSQGTFDDVLAGSSRTNWVHFKDFLYPNVRAWEDIVGKRWVGFQALMTRDELDERFKGKAKLVTLDATSEDVNNDEHARDKEPFKQATIYEIWDAKSRKVYWLPKQQTGTDFLDVEDDPLGLENFFPCPRPLMATLDNETLYPTADYIFYSDLAERLNLISAKIECLTEALKVAGCYDASCEEVAKLLDSAAENELIAVKNWPMLMDKGGLQGVIVWMPLKEIIVTLEQLYLAEDRTLERTFTQSGVSEVMRGQGDPRATATQRNQEMRFASGRLKRKRKQIDRFARDLLRIKAEILCEKLPPQAFAMLAAADQMPEKDRELLPQAIELLKNDKLRSFRVDIETDSTVAEDQAEERESLGQLYTGATKLMETGIAVGRQEPAMVPVLGEMLKMGVRLYKQGRPLESAIDTALDQIKQKVQGAGPEKPDPKLIEAQQKMQFKQVELQQKQAEAQQKIQMEQQKLQAEYELKYAELQAEMDVKLKKIALDAQASVQREQVKGEATLQAQAQAAMMQSPVLANAQPSGK